MDNSGIKADDGFEFVKYSGMPIKVVGVGNGGIKTVNALYAEEIPNVSFAICSPYPLPLKTSPVEEKVLLGGGKRSIPRITDTPDLGLECAEESRDEISRLFTETTEIVIVVAGLGRNTASGAAPEIARLAKEAGKITVGLITLPFLVEGEKTIVTAFEAAREMQKSTDVTIIINQDYLAEVYDKVTFLNMFQKTNEALADIVKSIAYLASGEGYVAINIEDVKSVLKEGGTAIAFTAAGEGPTRIMDALNGVLHTPLFKFLKAETSRRMVMKITSSKSAKNPMKAQELDAISNYVSQIQPPIAEFHWGIDYDDALGERIMITLLATGMDISDLTPPLSNEP